MIAPLAVFSASRGPPFQTDDPQPVPYQHFKFYTLSTGNIVRGDTQREGPAWEFNYGLIPNGQIHIIAPLTFDAPSGGRPQFGYGETELGFKYRFVDEDKSVLMVRRIPNHRNLARDNLRRLRSIPKTGGKGVPPVRN